MRLKQKLVLPGAMVLLCSLAASVRGDELAQKGRAIFNKNQHAVVTVEIVLKLTYTSGGQTSPSTEAKQDITGTVLDPSGLTIVALSACDPGELYQRMMPQQSGNKLDSEVSDVKILEADGTELPAEIVLRDQDLDMAFIRPKTKPADPMPCVDFGNAGPAQVLDEVITLNRLNKATSRAYAASVERVSAVIQKPRTFYIPDTTMSTTTLGSPAFLLDGRVLGVFVMRAISTAGGGPYNSRQNLAAIILPAEDILKAAKQAPEAKGDSGAKKTANESKDQN